MSWFVYVLKCADDTLYTGVTTDITRRVQEHNQCPKKGAKYTKVRRPVHLVYHEPQPCRSSACKREAAIKKLSRPQKLSLISQSTPA